MCFGFFIIILLLFKYIYRYLAHRVVFVKANIKRINFFFFSAFFGVPYVCAFDYLCFSIVFLCIFQALFSLVLLFVINLCF